MRRASFSPNYQEITDGLATAQSLFQTAQLHGLFCGYIVATLGQKNNQWEKFVFPKKPDDYCKRLLEDLYEYSYHQISDFSFEFALLLPDDDTDITVRTQALGLWCQGFLTGLEQCEIPIRNREDSEVTEALKDIVEIAQVSYDDISDQDEMEVTDDDETAYFELVEYVRLSVLMIFQELNRNSPSRSKPSRNNSLH